MKFQPTSLILVFLAIALGGFVYYQEFRQPKTEEAQSTSKPIFNFKEADVTSFTVKTSKQPTLAFERKPGVVPSVWQMTAPQTTQADDGAVAQSDRQTPDDRPRVLKCSHLPRFAAGNSRDRPPLHGLLPE